MDSPVRKMLKRNDYNRHKILRKIKRKNQQEHEKLTHAAENELKRKMRRMTKHPKFDEGKDGMLKLWNPNTGTWTVTDNNQNQYTVHPNSIGASELNITTPTVEIVGKRKEQPLGFSHNADWKGADRYTGQFADLLQPATLASRVVGSATNSLLQGMLTAPQYSSSGTTFRRNNFNLNSINSAVNTVGEGMSYLSPSHWIGGTGNEGLDFMFDMGAFKLMPGIKPAASRIPEYYTRLKNADMFDKVRGIKYTEDVYHGSRNPYNIWESRMYNDGDTGLHVGENLSPTAHFANGVHGGSVYKGRVKLKNEPIEVPDMNRWTTMNFERHLMDDDLYGNLSKLVQQQTGKSLGEILDEANALADEYIKHVNYDTTNFVPGAQIPSLLESIYRNQAFAETMKKYGLNFKYLNPHENVLGGKNYSYYLSDPTSVKWQGRYDYTESPKFIKGWKKRRDEWIGYDDYLRELMPENKDLFVPNDMNYNTPVMQGLTTNGRYVNPYIKASVLNNKRNNE